jgi:hypothetical protein
MGCDREVNVTATMKIAIAVAVAAVLAPWAAMADDWKDESGKGRYRAQGYGGQGGVTVHIPLPAPQPYYQPPGYYYAQPIPNGHLPPPGECKLWYPDRPPGHQPPPFKC